MARKATHISILHLDHPVSAWMRISGEKEGLEVLDFASSAGAAEESTEAAAARLAAFASEKQIAADTLYSVLPRHHLTTRILTLPSQDKNEIASMVALSAEEYVPFAADEIVFEQCLLQKLPSGESRVLVAIAHRDVVQQHVAQLRAMGLEPQHIYLSTTCLAAASAAQGAPSDATRYALVQLAAGGLEVLVFNENKLEFCRGVASTVNWRDPHEQAHAIEELAIEVRGSLATYRRESEDGEAVDRVCLCSDITDPSPFAEALFLETGKETSVMPVNRLLHQGGGALSEVAPLALLGAAHTARKGSTLTIDLIPEDLTRGRKEAHIRQRVLKIGAASMVVLLALLLWNVQLGMQRKAYMDELRQQVGAIEDTARSVEEKERQLRILREQVQRTGSLLEILATAAEAAPSAELNITKLSFGRNDGLDIWGLAKNLDLVANFAQSLRERGGQQLTFFRNARNLYTSQGAERGEQVFHYQMSIPFVSIEDEEGGGDGPRS